MAGIPAKRIGWACICGNVLDKELTCSCGKKFKLNKETDTIEEVK
jgi:UDP-2-acetamido-3-amino-2,3-dideoxy-glucuronate N-acetyltransferase